MELEYLEVEFGEEEMEIYRNDWTSDEGKESTIILCSFDDAGNLHINGQDLGPSVEKVWGDYDYEYDMKFSPRDVQTLLPLLLKETFNSKKELTFTRIKAIAKEAGVESNFWSWT